MAKGLSDSQAERQLSQIINFIQLEAREKAEEIRAKASEDYEMERQSRELQAKNKLERVFAQMEVERITQRRVAMAKELSSQQTKKLSEQSKMLESLVEEAGARLHALSTASPHQYKALLQELITQGALRGVLEAASKAASEQFTANTRADRERREAMKQDTLGARAPGAPGTASRAPPALPQVSVHLAISTSHHLPADSAGGVVVFSSDGTVVADNTLSKRLQLAAAGLQPVLKKVVFPSSVAAGLHASGAGAEDDTQDLLAGAS